MVSIKQEPSCWDDIKTISIKQELSNWDDSHNMDIDWEQDIGIQFMDLPTSEFLTSAVELEQTYGSATCPANGWEQPASSKTQIRNHDCMWSGTCFDQSHPGKMGCGTNHGPANTTQDQSEVSNKFSTVTAVAAASLNNNVVVSQKPILTPANTSAMNINNNLTAKMATVKQQIPAGRSLLISSRIKQQMNRIPTVSTSDFLRERETAVPLHRPDTPLSLDEDPPEFKHNIDLATCTIGSNRLSLTGHSRHYKNHQSHHDDPSSHRIINMLKEHLEDNESSSFRTCMASSTGEVGSLTDLLNDLEEMEEMESRDGDDSHGEELDSDTDSNADSSSRSSSKGGGISGGYTHAHNQEMSPSSSSSSSSSSYEYQGTHVGDHSYTRPKARYNLAELGVQTPSDSEDEEIDVVSIGEKNLPTNPTPRDKRHVESRVALKIRKHPQGNPSHHHRRRHSGEDYPSHHGMSSSSSQHSPSKSYGYSPNYLTPASSTSISGSNTPLPPNSSSISNPRKRPSKDDRSKNRHHQHRNKKQRIPGKTIARSPESSEEQETLEKRNLHNDMERQRRIGLKNLFEELKRQIPNLRDKERAPKVNILREAAVLCTRLNREQEQLNALRKQQQRLYARVRQLRTSLHTQRRVMD
ncbi:myc protein [Aedes aegypti]|uniref:BHLH domain-containing protein n=1 Tax=Aedes aegypti TaxID=7159 RepID=A0A6I8TEK1_AEDAE|nr:myc protein [Aedes aegypti]XP_021694470.1 myc protein [Aedes aegypti]